MQTPSGPRLVAGRPEVVRQQIVWLHFEQTSSAPSLLSEVRLVDCINIFVLSIIITNVSIMWNGISNLDNSDKL